MKNNLLIFTLLTASLCVLVGCTRQAAESADFDYSVFDSAYYYMSTSERGVVWAAVGTDTLQKDESLNRMHEAYLMECNTTIGCMYTDFCGEMPMGGSLCLSGLIGETDYVLLDFWASWCRPCRELMPELKKLYASQSEGQLEILGISLDDDYQRWVGCVESLDLPWAHISELSGWASTAAADYGVFCIPTLVLLDRDGRIIARGCDEEEVLSHIK